MKTTLKRRELIKRIERELGIDSQNNLAVGIAVGVMIMVCAGIYVFTSVMEVMMY